MEKKLVSLLFLKKNKYEFKNYLENSDVFFVNDEFTSKLTRIKIQAVSGRCENEPERKETREKVNYFQKHKYFRLMMIESMRSKQQLFV